MYYNLVYYIISHWCIIKKYCALMFLIEFMNVMKKIKVFHVKYQSNDNSVQFFCKTYVRSSTVNMIFWQQFMWNMVKTFTTISLTPYKYTNHTWLPIMRALTKFVYESDLASCYVCARLLHFRPQILRHLCHTKKYWL